MPRTIDVKKYLQTKNFLTMGIIISGILSLLIALIAYLGQNMGNFVISLPEETWRVGIKLSDEREFRFPRTRLVCDPIMDAEPITYTDFVSQIPTIRNTDGQFIDDRTGTGDGNYNYFAYTFYLRNDGLRTVDVEFKIVFATVTREIDESIRVLLITDEDPNGTIYHKYEPEIDNVSPDGIPVRDRPIWGKEFLSDKVVCSSVISTFARNQQKKFTIIIWIEGWDPQSDERIMGGRVRMDMTFDIIKTYDENY